jgi:hypothetical protein
LNQPPAGDNLNLLFAQQFCVGVNFRDTKSNGVCFSDPPIEGGLIRAAAGGATA